MCASDAEFYTEKAHCLIGRSRGCQDLVARPPTRGCDMSDVSEKIVNALIAPSPEAIAEVTTVNDDMKTVFDPMFVAARALIAEYVVKEELYQNTELELFQLSFAICETAITEEQQLYIRYRFAEEFGIRFIENTPFTTVVFKGLFPQRNPRADTKKACRLTAVFSKMKSRGITANTVIARFGEVDGGFRGWEEAPITAQPDDIVSWSPKTGQEMAAS